MFGRVSTAILLRRQKRLILVFGCFHHYTSNSLAHSFFDARVLWVKWLTGKNRKGFVVAWMWSRHSLPFASICTNGDEEAGTPTVPCSIQCSTYSSLDTQRRNPSALRLIRRRSVLVLAWRLCWISLNLKRTAVLVVPQNQRI